jgi:indolepyruvate decarboxylase
MIRSETTVAEYLLTRQKEIGIEHLFGVPGDFVLGFFEPGTEERCEVCRHMQ